MDIGDRVMWESQSMGVWKRKCGTVVGFKDKNLIVEVDSIVGFDPEKWCEIGERKQLKTPKRYTPREKFCKKLN